MLHFNPKIIEESELVPGSIASYEIDEFIALDRESTDELIKVLKSALHELKYLNDLMDESNPEKIELVIEKLSDKLDMLMV